MTAELQDLAASDPAAAVRRWLLESGALVPTFIAEALAKVTASHDVLTMTRRSPLPGPLTEHDRKVLTEWISGRLPVFGHGDRIRGMAERLLHLVEQLDADNKRLVETMHGVVDAHGRKQRASAERRIEAALDLLANCSADCDCGMIDHRAVEAVLDGEIDLSAVPCPHTSTERGAWNPSREVYVHEKKLVCSVCLRVSNGYSEAEQRRG